MNGVLFVFLKSLSVVIGVAFLAALIRQLIIGRQNTNHSVSGSNNHAMKEYAGKYSICKSIEEDNEEF